MLGVEPHPVLEATGAFGSMRLGKLEPKEDPRTLRMAAYLEPAALPPIPEGFTVASLRSWPMYGNDALGDCTLAAAGHMIQAWSHAAGHARTPALSTVERAYWETGSPPSASGAAGGPTDTGRVELDVLNYWRARGVGKDKIAAYVAIDPKDQAHMQAAIYLFGGVYAGLSLPISAQQQKVWDVVPPLVGPNRPGSWGGHAVPFIAYDKDGLTAVTWGAEMKATWRFNSAYTDEAYAIISQDWLTKAGESVQGFDLAALTADLAAL